MNYKICPTCKKPYKDDIEKQYIEEVGECIMCDKIRADVQTNFFEAYYDWNSKYN